MAQSERHDKLRRWLVSRRCVTPAWAIEQLDVSRSTLTRDIAFLRDRLGMPIVWSPDRQGWQIDREAGAATAQFELPGLWFSADTRWAAASRHLPVSTVRLRALGNPSRHTCRPDITFVVARSVRRRRSSIRFGGSFRGAASQTPSRSWSRPWEQQPGWRCTCLVGRRTGAYSSESAVDKRFDFCSLRPSSGPSAWATRAASVSASASFDRCGADRGMAARAGSHATLCAATTPPPS